MKVYVVWFALIMLAASILVVGAEDGIQDVQGAGDADALQDGLQEGASDLEDEDDLEEELQEYEIEENVTPTQVADDIEDDVSTDAELASEAGLTSEELSDAQEAGARIGLKQYILNIQLAKKIMRHDVIATAIIDFLKENGKDTSPLETLKSQILSLRAIDEQRLTGREFAERVTQLRRLSNSFKEEVRRLTPEDLTQDLKDAVHAALESKKEELKDAAEEKIRQFHNMKAQQKEFRKLAKHLRTVQEEGVKMEAVKERYDALKSLQEKYLGQNATKENAAKFREEWKTYLESLKAEREEARLTAQRANSYMRVKEVREVLADAEAEGESTAELQEKHAVLLRELKQAQNSKDLNELKRIAKASHDLAEDKRLDRRMQDVRAKKAAMPRQVAKARVANRESMKSGSAENRMDKSTESESTRMR
ncbi:MAG TPA: hypothetical protein VJB08_01675 [Candidatus Nanoarchaeia archaeon]|nr:hypothetical protein [Candidatus Nanoarchaeia archaeon]